MTSDPLAAVQKLQSIVTTLAPSLSPQVLPKTVEYGLDLILSLCKTEEQRQTLMALVRSSKPNIDEASETHQEGDTDQEEENEDGEYLEPQVVGTIDVKNRVFAVQKVQWMHERDAVVHEFARFMELQLENPIAAKQVVHYFLERNGHKFDDLMLAQQCFSAAFALQTLLRAFPKLPITVDGKVVEMTEDSDVAEVFASLLAPQAKKKNKATTAQESAKKSKSKQHKSKKRKST